MENEIERLIRLDKLELEKQVDLDPLFPQRLRRRLQARRSPAKGLAWRLGWTSAFCLIIALLTLIHLQWLPGLASRPEAGRPGVQITLFPQELQNTIYQSFIEVAKWEK